MTAYCVGELEELRACDKKLVAAEGLEIGVYFVDGEIRAWRSVCPHKGARICRGLVGGTNLPSGVYEYEYGMEGRVLRCPFHAWEFDLLTGQFLLDPKVKLKGYPAYIQDNRVYIELQGGK